MNLASNQTPGFVLVPLSPSGCVTKQLPSRLLRSSCCPLGTIENIMYWVRNKEVGEREKKILQIQTKEYRLLCIGRKVLLCIDRKVL